MTKATDAANALLEEMNKGTDVHAMFADGMKESLLISGHKISYWEEKFHMKIPGDLTPAQCKNMSMELLRLNHEATFYLAIANAKLQLIKRGNDAAYQARFAEIVTQYKKDGKRLPGQDTLRSMSSDGLGDIESAKVIADIEQKFWKGILEDIHTARRLIESASMNLAVELKTMNNERAIEHLAKANQSRY